MAYTTIHNGVDIIQAYGVYAFVLYNMKVVGWHDAHHIDLAMAWYVEVRGE